jgi:hypothetical protein
MRIANLRFVGLIVLTMVPATAKAFPAGSVRTEAGSDLYLV